MNKWSKEQLEEMCGDDVIDQLQFLAGCNRHRYLNDTVSRTTYMIPDGWIIPDESLRQFAELIIRECLQMADDFEIEVNRAGLVDKIKFHFGVEE